MVCILGLVFLESLFFSLPVYEKLELSNLDSKVLQIENLFESEKEHLDLFCKDWAFWDDTLRYVLGEDSRYVESNLGIETFINADLHFILIFDQYNQILNYWRYNPETGIYIETSETQNIPGYEYFSFMVSGNDSDEWQVAGVVDEGEGTLSIFAARPILSTGGKGKPAGTFIMGRIMDESFMTGLSRNLQQDFSLKTEVPSSAGGRLSSRGIPYFIRDDSFLNMDEWTVAVPIPIVGGDTEFYMTFPYVPAVRIQGVRTVIEKDLLFIIILGFLITFYFITMRVAILNPLVRLTQYVENKSGDFFSEYTDSSHLNEIHKLNHRFHTLFDTMTRQYRMMEFHAGTDALTGMENRRSILERLDLLCRREDPGDSIAVIMADIDHFKAVNDNFGHLGGDDVLRRMGPILHSCLRNDDYVGRYGGEEFIILIVNKPEDTVGKMAERIRLIVQESEWPSVDCDITVSCGYFHSPCPVQPESLIAEADKNLYLAKEQGRNRVVGPD